MSKEKAEITSKMLTDKLSIDYGINNADITLIKAGEENDNFLVEESNNKYVFRVYNLSHSIRGERTEDSVKLELKFVFAAIKAGIPAPKPIPAKNGQLFSKFEKDGNTVFSTLFSFMVGHSSDGFDANKAAQLGKIVNRLYMVGFSFQEVPTEVEINIVDRSLDKYQNFLDSKMSISDEISNILISLKSKVDDNKIDLENLRKGLIHGDLKLANLFFKGNVLSAVLDFDDYRYSFLIEEAVMALMHNLNSKTENLLRSGNYTSFINELTNPKLALDLKCLNYLLSARLLYDLCKYLSAGKTDLVREILDDENVKRYIL